MKNFRDKKIEMREKSEESYLGLRNNKDELKYIHTAHLIYETIFAR